MEREKRFELSTLSLATRCSTTELLPLIYMYILPNVHGLKRMKGCFLHNFLENIF